MLHELHNKVLFRNAREYLTAESHIPEGLKAVAKESEGFRMRVHEFNRVCELLNKGQDHELNPDIYGNALALRGLIGDRQIPNISEVVWSKNPEWYAAARKTFQDINTFIEDSEWKFPREVADPNMLVSGLLIEGYGRFLGNLYGEDDTREEITRRFVVGFEEVLFQDYQGSDLFNDVLPWMISEREDFSPSIRRRLDSRVAQSE